MAKPVYYGWILLGVLWLVFAFNLGFPAYGGPVINSAMARELGFSRETLGLITSFYIIMSGLPGPLVAMSVNRFGVRRTLLAGSTLNVAGAVFMATVANSGIAAYFGFGLLIGGGRLHRSGHREPDRSVALVRTPPCDGDVHPVFGRRDRRLRRDQTRVARSHRRDRQLAQRLVGHRRPVRARRRARTGVREGTARGHGPDCRWRKSRRAGFAAEAQAGLRRRPHPGSSAMRCAHRVTG